VSVTGRPACERVSATEVFTYPDTVTGSAKRAVAVAFVIVTLVADCPYTEMFFVAALERYGAVGAGVYAAVSVDAFAATASG